MKLILPEYCRNFRCIAEKCRDNCCIGWGISIDDRTAAAYRQVDGRFGKRLARSIDHDGQCFINDENRRCPFLNENNLCDIITELGEDMLCDICDRHPRYFEWFTDCIEGGIGLCCEEAARLILGSEEQDTYVTEAPERLLCGDADEDCDLLFYAFMKEARQRITDLLFDKSIGLDDALERVVCYAGELQELIDEYEIYAVPDVTGSRAAFNTAEALGFLLEAETADDDQKRLICDLNGYFGSVPDGDVIKRENEDELRNIAVYFIRRYFMKALYSGNLYPKVMFAVFGTRVINVMFNRTGTPSFGEKCLLAKTFSKIVEYSEDNLCLIMNNYEY